MGFAFPVAMPLPTSGNGFHCYQMLETDMKRRSQHTLLALLATAFVVFAMGCETLHPPHVMEPLDNYGGGGGDPS